LTRSLFTEVPRSGILRTSPLRSSRKFAVARSVAPRPSIGPGLCGLLRVGPAQEHGERDKQDVQGEEREGRVDRPNPKPYQGVAKASLKALHSVRVTVSRVSRANLKPYSPNYVEGKFSRREQMFAVADNPRIADVVENE
jgi:hypothetical protein